MSGKGDKRRPGTGYADNWDRIFGKKEERKPSGGQIWMLKSAMETPYMEQAAAARALADAQESKLMTLSEAQKAGYSMEHDNCGPSVSGAVIRVGKWDDALNCLQFIDVRPDADIEQPAKTCQHCRYWSEANQPVGFGCCLNGAIGAFHERGESRIWLVPPAEFGCLRWEGNV
jgi:hypothetical protein